MIFFVVMFTFYLVNTKVPGVKLRMYHQRLSAIGNQHLRLRMAGAFEMHPAFAGKIK